LLQLIETIEIVTLPCLEGKSFLVGGICLVAETISWLACFIVSVEKEMGYLPRESMASWARGRACSRSEITESMAESMAGVREILKVMFYDLQLLFRD
jgi:hypothetical protein